MTRGGQVAAIVASALLLVGCTPTSPAPTDTGAAVTSVTVDSDVVYRTVDGQRLLLEACTPKPARRAPALVIVHSGGFSSGSRTDLDFICRAAAKAGIATFSVDYRLLPARYPAQTDDVAAALRWLTQPRQLQRFSLQPGRLGLLGTSAGAVIAAELATRTPQTPSVPRLDAVVLMSGLYDANGDLGALRTTAESYLGCDTNTAACDTVKRDASAIDSVRHGDPPILLVGSTQEVAPLSQLQTFAAALEKAAVPHQTIVVPGTAHAEAVLVSDPSVENRVLLFLQHRLSPTR